MRFRKIKQLKRGHTASKWPVQASGIFFFFFFTLTPVLMPLKGRWVGKTLSFVEKESLITRPQFSEICKSSTCSTLNWLLFLSFSWKFAGIPRDTWIWPQWPFPRGSGILLSNQDSCAKTPAPLATQLLTNLRYLEVLLLCGLSGVLWTRSTTAHRKRGTGKGEKTYLGDVVLTETKWIVSISEVGSNSSSRQWVPRTWQQGIWHLPPKDDEEKRSPQLVFTYWTPKSHAFLCF